MQKVERWRLQELALILKKMAELLKKGENNEWANVFAHFLVETQDTLTRQTQDVEVLKRLVYNIKNCFSGMSSFKNLVLRHDNSVEMSRLNQAFLDEKLQLLEALRELEKGMAEYRH